MEKLSIADRQLVAICRAIAAEARLVIMDEPTASLTRQEVDGLLRVVNELKAAGICVVFVSHRLDEVMEVADRISVMRDGKLVGTWPASELDSHELAFLMTGQRFHYSPLPPLPPAEQAPLLEVRNLSRGEKYRNVNLALRGGEIVSIVGLLGAGRTELCLSLFGMTRPDSGEIRIEGQAVQLHNNREAVRHGIGYVSEDRLTQGLIMEQSIYDNTIVTVFDRLHTSLGLLDHVKATELVNRLIRDLNIKVSDSALPVKTLSGGNAQRIAIAKWVATQPKILILDSPTVGVDIANKEDLPDRPRSGAAGHGGADDLRRDPGSLLQQPSGDGDAQGRTDRRIRAAPEYRATDRRGGEWISHYWPAWPGGTSFISACWCCCWRSA